MQNVGREQNTANSFLGKLFFLNTLQQHKREGIDLTINTKKGGGMEKFLKGRAILRRGDCVGKWRDAANLGIFSSRDVANIITVTFNYILVIVI